MMTTTRWPGSYCTKAMGETRDARERERAVSVYIQRDGAHPGKKSEQTGFCYGRPTVGDGYIGRRKLAGWSLL